MLPKLPRLEETPLSLRDLEEEVRPLEEDRSGDSSPKDLGAHCPHVWGLSIHRKPCFCWMYKLRCVNETDLVQRIWLELIVG